AGEAVGVEGTAGDTQRHHLIGRLRSRLEDDGSRRAARPGETDDGGRMAGPAHVGEIPLWIGPFEGEPSRTGLPAEEGSAAVEEEIVAPGGAGEAPDLEIVRATSHEGERLRLDPSAGEIGAPPPAPPAAL